MSTGLDLHDLPFSLSVKGKDASYNYSYITFSANKTVGFFPHMSLSEGFDD